MDGYEFNKIAAAVLSALLLMFGSATLFEIWKGGHGPKAVGYTLPAPKVASLVGGGAADAGVTFPKVADLMAKASVDGGASAFKKCTSCHTPDKGGKNGIGPNLWGAVGRKVGAIDSFAYSPAMKAKGGEWTWENLVSYINAPAAAVPGNKMAFAGIKDAGELADLMVYLRSLSDSPVALPK
jgi:cytochrome c